MRVQVLNNCQGPFYVQLPHANGGKTIGNTVVLHPGLNLVDADTWGVMKKNPSVVGFLKEKIQFSKASEADLSKVGQTKLKAFDRGVHDTNAFADKDGKSIDLDEAKSMIAMTQDTDYLASWKQGQQLGGDISKAIDARLIEITSGIEPQAT